MPEAQPEHLQGTQFLCLHRVDGHLQMGSHLLVAKTLEIGQVDHLATTLGQLLQRLVYVAEYLGLYDPFQDGVVLQRFLLPQLVLLFHFFVFV